MGIRLDRDAYLYGMLHARDIMEAHQGNGMKALEQEIKVRTGGMKLPANIDFCAVTELARQQMKPELQCISVAMAWALEKGLKLPATRMAVFLDIFNSKVDDYRADSELLKMDARILDQSWGGAVAAGEKWFKMYEERRDKEQTKEEEQK